MEFWDRTSLSQVCGLSSGWLFVYFLYLGHPSGNKPLKHGDVFCFWFLDDAESEDSPLGFWWCPVQWDPFLFALDDITPQD